VRLFGYSQENSKCEFEKEKYNYNWVPNPPKDHLDKYNMFLEQVEKTVFND
jgi:hypothetical protein